MFDSIDDALAIAIGHHQAGRLAQAETVYRQILAAQPDHAQTMQHFGILAAQVERFDIAFDLFRRAIAIDPTVADFYVNFGTALTDSGRLDDAILCYRQALLLQPDFATSHYNLGNCLLRTGHLEDAIASHERAIALQPDFAAAHDALGGDLLAKGLINEALASYRRAIALDPENAAAHRSYGIALLVTGDFASGWPEYEWRLRLPRVRRLSVAQPRWDGSDLAGRTILLHSEQGFGDTIFAIRYVDMVIERGGRPLVACQPELTRLLRGSLEGRAEIVDAAALPPFDVHCPLMSLPFAFGTTVETIPGKTPYLWADPVDVETWRERLTEDRSKLKVGLAWAGSKNHKNDHNRSLPFAALQPIVETAQASFYSLQTGAAAQQAAGAGLIDWTNELRDFGDTAALIANLDLVITVDTSVAHLAGALGTPTWMLVPFGPDWRWLLDRDDCPWYPTMRLFRQPAIGDWASVMEDVAARISRDEVD